MELPSFFQKSRPTSAMILRGLAPEKFASPSSEPSCPLCTASFARFLPISPVTTAASASSLATFWKPSSLSRSAPVFARPISISRDLARS